MVEKMNIFDSSFESLVLEKNSKNEAEVFSFIYEEKKYWLKKARATKSNLFHKIFYSLSKIDVLLPVEAKTSKEALEFETNKLINFNENNIKAAKVAYRNDDFFVLEDCGNNIYSFLKKKNFNKDKKEEILKKAIISLSEIHNKGFYHGGAQIRNFTFFEDEIYIIDLEDSFKEDISLETLQFRDFLLFLLSLLKLNGKYEINFIDVINAYVTLTKKTSYIKKLKDIGLRFSFLIPLGKLLRPILSKDANAVVEFLTIIKNLKVK